MSFALPLALLVGLLVAGPVIAHVVRRSETPEQKLPTFRLLERAMAESQKRRRLDDRWLFALRALAVLLATLAAAAPFVRVPLELGDGRACALAVVVDGSRSMLARRGTSPILELAKARAARAVSELPSGSEITIVLASDPPLVLADRAADPAAAARTTERITAAGAVGGDTLAAAVHLATRRLHASSHATRRLVVLSDFARHVDTRELAIPAGVAVDFARVEPSDARNAAVSLDTIRIATDDANARIVRGFVHGFAYDRPTDLALELDGDRVDHESATPAETPAPVELRSRAPRGVATARLVADVDDALPEDDELAFVLRVPSETRVLFIDGEPATNRYDDEVGLAARALELVPPNERRFESTRVDLGAVDAAMLDRHDVVVLANVDSVPATLARELVRRVQGGLGVLVAPGDRTDGRALSRSLDAILPARLAGYSRCEDRRGVVRRDAPDSLSTRGLRDVVHRGCTEVDATLGRSRVALARDDGSALLVLGDARRGRVAVLSSALDAEGSDLPLRPGFLPFLASLLSYLDGSASAANDRVLAGSSATLGEPGLVVRAPSGDERTSDARGQVGPLRELGPHLVLRDGVPDADASFTVVADPAEADLRPAALPRAQGHAGRASRGTLERDLSSPVFAFLGIALVAEGFLRERQRGSRRASTTRGTPP